MAQNGKNALERVSALLEMANKRENGVHALKILHTRKNG